MGFDSKSIGAVIMILAVIALVIGALVYVGAANWFGRLPGDIRIENERGGFYFPITSMILVSIALSVLSYLWQKFR